MSFLGQRGAFPLVTKIARAAEALVGEDAPIEVAGPSGSAPTAPATPLQADDPVKVRVNCVDYELPASVVAKYPKLTDPGARFLLNFDSLLPLLYGYPPSSIPATMLDEPHEKMIFLSNIEFLEIPIGNDLILHLSKTLRDEVQQASDYIRGKAGSKGKTKMRYCNLRESEIFCAEYDDVFRSHGANVTPMEILRYLEAGTSALLDKVVLIDFQSTNCVMGFVRAFLKRFLDS